MKSCTQDLGSARIVPLTAGAAGPCLFLIPGTGGKFDGFVSLAPYLKVSMPVFTIEARGLDENSTPDTNVEEMARHYLAQLRTVQRVGPYFLLGHSFGGLVALEMAQRLRESGERIGCLIMLDTPTPAKYWPFFFYLKHCVRRMRRYYREFLTLPMQDNLGRLYTKLSSRSVDPGRMPTNVMIGGNVARVVVAHSIARENYILRFYADKVIFFRPQEAAAGYESLWRDHVRDLQILPAAGDHLSMVQPPHVTSLAADLFKCINMSMGIA